jgi:hypothetical protein
MAKQGSYPMGARTLANGDTATGVVTSATADIPVESLRTFVISTGELNPDNETAPGALDGTEAWSIRKAGAWAKTTLAAVASYVLSAVSNNSDRTKGAALVGYDPTGTGATPTNVQAFLDTFKQYPSGQFYANAGGKVNRVRDRLFVGPAALNDGTNTAVQADWLTTYQLAKGRTYGYVQTSQFSALNDSPGLDALTTAVFGAQTAGRPSSGSQVIAATGMGVNNANTGQAANAAWGAYLEAFRDTTADGNGGAYGLEIDTMNFTSSTPVTDPYAQANDQTIGIQLASGGGFPGTLYGTTAGINFQNNNAKFDIGVVFGSTSLTGSDGTSGTGIALALAKGHSFQWYGPGSVKTSSIAAYGTTTAAGVKQQFSDNLVQWLNASTVPLLNVAGAASAVNYVQTSNAATGVAPTLAALGSDTNIQLALSGKGTGGVVLKGTGTNDNAAAGSVGEYGQQTATGVSLTTGTPANVTSVPLAAGDYEVWGVATFVPAAGTSPTLLQYGTNTVSATLGGLGTLGFLNLAFPAGQPQGQVVPRQRITLASAGNVYLVVNANFTGGTMTANGALNWRRIR